MAYFAGSNGDDYLVGTDHADRFAPLRGHDFVFGGAGLDSLVLDYSGAGSTNYSYAYVHSAGDSLNGFVQSGDGQNWVSFDSIERLEFKLDNGDGNFWLEGSALGLGATMDVDAGLGVDTLEANFTTLGATAFEIGVNGKVKVNGSTFTNFENYFVQFGSGSDTVKLAAGNDVVLAGAGNDIVDVGDGDDLVIAGDGNDHVIGGGGNDTLYGEGGSNILIGGIGDDSLVSQGSDIVDGGEGYDYWQGDYQASNNNLTYTYNGSSGSVSNGTTVSSVEAATIFSGSGDDQFIISGVMKTPEGASSVIIWGGAGVDRLDLNLANGVVGTDIIAINEEGSSFSGSTNNGASYSDLEFASFTGDAGDTARLGLSTFGSDVHLTVQPDGTLTSNIGVTLFNYGAFRIDLGEGNDTVLGGSKRDVIQGSGGDDVINGGGGGDSVFGGEGADLFDFDALANFGSGSIDVINDFTSADGDKIDLQDVFAGDFSFVGNDPFTASGAAEIHLQNAIGGNTLVQGDINGDGVADFTFIVLGTQSLGSSDFLF